MTALTDTLEFDEYVPLAEQPVAVQRWVARTLTTAPTVVDTEPCGSELHRPVREIWQFISAEIVRYTAYSQAATHPACFAVAHVVLVLRPRLV